MAPASDCSVWPRSMNGDKHPRGCKGAVWGNGKPNKDYCLSTGSSKGRFPWWKDCCKWIDNIGCALKGKLHNLDKNM